jgi:hypothetical protein
MGSGAKSYMRKGFLKGLSYKIDLENVDKN